MKVALDTNVLAYAEGLGDEARCGMALRLVEQLPGTQVVLPAQALGELSRVLAAKAKRSAALVREAVLGWAGPTASKWPTPPGWPSSQRWTSRSITSCPCGMRSSFPWQLRAAAGYC